jgi:hypothetical protein
MDNELVEFDRLRGRSDRVRGAVGKSILYNIAASPGYVGIVVWRWWGGIITT